MTVGYLANNILPARTGEFVRVLMLARYESIPSSTVLATVVLERIIELIVTVLLLYAVVLFFPLPATIQNTGIVLGILGLICFFILASFQIWRNLYYQIIKKVLWFLPPDWLDKISSIIYHFINGISSLSNFRNSFSFLWYTFIIWLIEIISLWLVASAFNINLTLGESLFVLLSIGIGTIIPSSPGYIGTYEFFAINALNAINIDGSNAIAFVFVMHALTFIFPLIMGAICLIISGHSLLSLKKESINVGMLEK
jgi:hypothetical protein